MRYLARYLALTTLLAATLPPLASSAPVEFNRDVRGILSDKCYACHGPDEKKRLSGLRLDTPEGAMADLGGRHGVVPGDLEGSEVYRRIRAEEPARRMPPAYAEKQLSEDEVRTLEAWIEQGARYQRHWAFIAPEKASAPAVDEPEWNANAIDRFVFARLQEEGLEPTPEAARSTLIRRVTLDLTGIPPTPAEVAAFVGDSSPDAYEKVVDRLLGSPRYGERMAIRWLDASRYADTNGYQTDAPRIQWRWRDWVIDAFNSNKPFDEFTVEQLAGDLLPNPTTEQIIATGFSRNHRANSEGGIVPEEYLVEYVVDRVDTTATVWLGLTMGCARCHDHKYDPITQREFYQVYAYFNNIPERGRVFKYGNTPPMITAPTDAQGERLAALDESVARSEADFERLAPKIAKSQAKWEKSLAGRSDERWFSGRDLVAHISFDDAEPQFEGGEAMLSEGRLGRGGEFDGERFVNVGDVAKYGYQDRFTLSAWIRPDAANGAIIARTRRDAGDSQDRGFGGYGLYLIDGKLQFNLISRWLDDGLRVETAEALPLGEWRHVAVTYDGSRFAAGIDLFVDGKRAEKTVILDLMNQQTGVKEPLLIGAGGGLEEAFKGAIDEVRIYARDLPEEGIAALAETKSLGELTALAPAERSPERNGLLRRAFLEQHGPASIREPWEALEQLRRKREDYFDGLPTVMVMQEKAEIEQAHILNRGAYDQPREEVSRNVPEVLPPLPDDAPPNRLGFAQWLVDPKHPLTSRVAVNRLWQMLFGRGIVKTVEDFGSQGEWPTHPELLDWLAVDFVESGWDVKRLVKQMVLSRTYRQSSQASPALVAKDPDNKLLARGPRVRLPAEMLRDQALAVSGLLVEELGGPSVKPYQPDGLWRELAGGEGYVQDHGDALYRRSLYAFWKRTSPPPWMMNFDSAAREACQVRETRTNTPLQALNLMNDVTYVEAARKIAERMLLEGGRTPEERLAFGFQLATARAPRPDESTVLRDSLAHYMSRYRNDPEGAKALVSAGESPRTESLDLVEHAGYAAVASLILNLDETITKE